MKLSKALGERELAAYWSGLSERYLARDPEALAVVCCAGLPPWFNRFLDRYQRLALARLTRDVDFRGARVLDLGTGIGRWARWFAERGAGQVVGIDFESRRLALACGRTESRAVAYERMSVDRLGFAAEAFDVVNCVTVLQHVDRAAKERTLAEIARVLRPGGWVTLFELTDTSDDAPHVFPERREAWEELCRGVGLRLVRTVGDQYTPLLRACKALVGRAFGARRRRWIDAFKSAGPDRSPLRPSVLGLRALVLLSYPLEEVCQRALPAGAAKITGFLLRKGEEAAA